ncbi:MAG TPA: glycosyltransferase [Candidatus Eisenbacteria bacterium]
MPSVSIVLPTRDRPERLHLALEAVARQTHPELELILVRDGGAPLDEAAREAIARLDFPTTLLEHDDPPEGPARSRNRGIETARAEAFAFLDDDDDWTADHIARLAAALDREPRADVVYSDVRVVNEEEGAERRIARDFDFAVFSRDGFIPPSAMAARRPVFERFGPFDPEFAASEDWEWLVRIAKGGGVIARVPGATATVRIHGGGASRISPDRLAERRRCLALLSERHGLPPIEPKTFWEVAEALCRDPNATTP